MTPEGDDELRAGTPALPRPGKGTRLTANRLGYLLSARTGGGSFGHPFKPSLVGSGLRFSRGVVMAVDGGAVIEPKIGSVPISGAPGVSQPTLALLPGVANANGESWACVEVTPDEKGMLTKDSLVQIVHRGAPQLPGTPVGRQAIALIVWQDKRPRLVEAIVKFNLRYVRFDPPAGGGAKRHFFL